MDTIQAYLQLLLSLLICVHIFDHIVGPSITGLMDQTENERDTTSFTCQADGEPLPTISWYFNGVPLNESNAAKYTITDRQMPNSNSEILSIMSLESSDVGTYTCNATNVVASNTSSAVLTVNGELIILVF